MESYRKNLKIDRKDLLSKVVNSWKRVLICAVVFVVLCFGYAFLTTGYIPKFSNAPTKITLEELKTNLKGKLTVAEAKDVELAYNACKECEKLYSESGSPENSIELVKATQQLIAIKSEFTPNQQMYYNALFEGEDGAVSKAFAKKINQSYAPDENGFSSIYFVYAALIGAVLSIITTITK